GVHPRLQRHGGGQVQRGGVGDGDPAVGAVERQGVAVLAGRRPGGVGDGAGVAVAGGVGHRRAAALVEAVGRHQAGVAGRGGGAGLVGGGADVAGRVLGGDQVVVGAGRQARVGVAGGGRLGDAVGRRGGEAGGGRAVHVVIRHAHVVGGRAPAQADRADAAGGGQVARGRGGLGVAGAVVEGDVQP